MQLLRLRLGLLLMNRRKWWWACSLGSGLSKILSVILCFCCSTSVISPYCIDQVHFWHFNMTWIKQQDRIHCWLIERLLTGGRFIATRVCIFAHMAAAPFSNSMDVEGDHAVYHVICVALCIIFVCWSAGRCKLQAALQQHLKVRHVACSSCCYYLAVAYAIFITIACRIWHYIFM